MTEVNFNKVENDPRVMFSTLSPSIFKFLLSL